MDRWMYGWREEQISEWTHGKRHMDNNDEQKEGNALFNDTLNTFYLMLYGVRHMVKEHSDSERGNPLPIY